MLMELTSAKPISDKSEKTSQSSHKSQPCTKEVSSTTLTQVERLMKLRFSLSLRKLVLTKSSSKRRRRKLIRRRRNRKTRLRKKNKKKKLKTTL